MKIDYLVVGQGLCGTWLSYFLTKANKKVLVIDNGKPNAASRVASGVINPVTGRRIARTWRIEELLPFATSAYQQISQELETTIAWETSILHFHPNQQMQAAFTGKIAEAPEFLHQCADEEWKSYFNFHHSVTAVAPALLIQLHPLLHRWKQKLEQINALRNDTFLLEELQVNNSSIRYKEYEAEKIIFCDGVAGFKNPYFKHLPFSYNKGEALLASIPGLPATFIYKNKYSIVPWKDGLFWIGATYDWKHIDEEPTQAFRKDVEFFLQQFLKLPFEIVDHLVSARPANLERRPFAGLHPLYPAVGILNGMGTKGCSLAPFFAKQLANLLLNNSPIYPDADITRFQKILSKYNF